MPAETRSGGEAPLTAIGRRQRASRTNCPLPTAQRRPEPLMEDGALRAQCLACGACEAARRLAQAFSHPDTGSMVSLLMETSGAALQPAA
jgi:hypothetical protein